MQLTMNRRTFGCQQRQGMKKGFTLTEVIVSMVILALLAAGFFSAAVSGRKLTWRSRMRFTAAEIAHRRLEELRANVRADTWNLAASPLNPSGAWTAWVASPENPAFETRYVVSSINAPFVSDARNISMQVRWNDTTI